MFVSRATIERPGRERLFRGQTLAPHVAESDRSRGRLADMGTADALDKGEARAEKFVLRLAKELRSESAASTSQWTVRGGFGSTKARSPDHRLCRRGLSLCIGPKTWGAWLAVNGMVD